MKNRNDYYTPAEAASAAGVTRRTIYRHLDSGKLTRINPVPGLSGILIPRSEVEGLNQKEQRT